VAAVLDGGAASGGRPSTVVAIVGGELRSLLPGPVAPRG
jgi:tRNA A37 threonylcarbamoyladenosine synthetase subunit TsaC/SUA5/YrdC